MAIGLGIVGTIFAAIAALLLSDIYGVRFFDAVAGQALTVSAIMGVGSAIVAAVFFAACAIVVTLETQRRPN